jgi:hypothetical protein
MSDLDYPYPRTKKEKEAADQAVKEAKDKKRQEAESRAPTTKTGMGRGFNKGGTACYKKGGVIDGIAKKGKTRCRTV